ncbi:Glucan 1,3-beta-glucosidase 3 [Vanrija albida]|uniref:Glucan 1,3-beta-glucosidase 3 n=1 Tax=Vanrija albida TaxID=181172 RepID=A0ABR3PZ77_9TREE
MGLFDKLSSKFKSNEGPDPEAFSFPPPSPPIPLEHSLIRYRKQRGINLGSWFTTENWLATKLYEGAVNPKGSDYDLARGANPKEAMERHWDTWITEPDWQWIKDRGFNTVRLPIGYYHLSSVLPDILKGTEYEPFADIYSGAWPRILKAVETAASHGLGVLVDLHAAPGAQNDDGHSGLSNGKVNFWKVNNLASTSIALRFLASTFNSNPHVVGLELLNEPKNNDQLQAWYERTLWEVRQVAGPEFPIYLSDSWDAQWYAPFVGKRDDFVVLDHHLYRCFDASDRALTGPQHADKLRNEFAGTFAQWCGQARGNLVVGEWSAGLDDSCLPPNTPAGERDAHKRAWVAAQLEVYDRCAGYYFWTLKTDRDWDAGWSAYNAGQAEILPSTVVRRAFSPPPQGALDAAAEQAFNAHVGYWSQHGGSPNPQAFADGFRRGWDDALLFVKADGVSELGFVSQWARRREVEAGARGIWEFEHGFNQGVAACYAASA